MRTRQLGSTTLQLSEVGFGAWAIGGGNWEYGWGSQDDDEAVAAMNRALELGVNWIDTAAVYGLGHSEELVARVIRGRRDDVIVATKCSLVWDDQGRIDCVLRGDSIRRECEASLRRLGTDYIDLYQIHWPRDEERIEEAWATMLRLVEEGKVRHAGVSNFDVGQLERCRPLGAVASLQPPYSMIRPEVEEDILPYCAEHRIGVVAYSPMGSGLLTGSFDRARLQANDWRSRDPNFNPPLLEVNLRLAEGLGRVAAGRGKTAAQLALAWVLRRAEVTSAIAGARRPSQIEETVGGAEWDLTAEELAAVEGLLAERQRAIMS